MEFPRECAMVQAGEKQRPEDYGLQNPHQTWEDSDENVVKEHEVGDDEKQASVETILNNAYIGNLSINNCFGISKASVWNS